MMKQKYIIACQYKEWYGCPDNVGDPAHGRHKMKGGEDFVFEGDHNTLDNEDEIIAKFNAIYDQPDRFTRYEARSIEFWIDPTPIEFDPTTNQATLPEFW